MRQTVGNHLVLHTFVDNEDMEISNIRWSSDGQRIGFNQHNASKATVIEMEYTK